MPKEDNLGISLLKKGKRGLILAIFSRMFAILVLLLLQSLVLVGAFRWFEKFLPHIFGGTLLYSIIMVLYLLNRHMEPTVKITWMVIIMAVPVFGTLLFIFIQSDLGHRALKQRVSKMMKETQPLLPGQEDTLEKLEEKSPGSAALARYMDKSGSFPVYDNTEVTYFPLGEDKFQEMLVQLKKAEHFIFMEYFIVNEGQMWGQILEILKEKAAQGVEVRVMYDGTCEFALLPHNYPQKLQSLGIHCKVFSPVSPFVSTHYNYRDHRKILVIDGHTAFTGGVNLSDEYINRASKYGHWKDTAVMLQGPAAESFTFLFLQMWNLNEKHPDFSGFSGNSRQTSKTSQGFVIPYGDCPVDNYRVGEQVYLDILNRAKKYVHIMTPYLILDGELEAALIYAAQRGVDVRLILPGIPDKIMPYALASTHYKTLLAAGVKIGEYTPGFVHAKVCVCDDQEAVVGTINLDYRSLYHHFECAVYLFGVSCISRIQQDFAETWDQCKEITPGNRKQIRLYRKFIGFLLKPLAPLM